MLAWLAAGVDFLTDVSPADWVLERLRPWDPNEARLQSFAPDGFEQYALVFHPPGYRPGRRGGLEVTGGKKWADLARASGIVLSPDISFSEVSGLGPEDQRELDELAPGAGELPPDSCDTVAAALRPHTRNPDCCWFWLWEGNGAFRRQSPRPLLRADATGEELRRI